MKVDENITERIAVPRLRSQIRDEEESAPAVEEPQRLRSEDEVVTRPIRKL